ncbi:MAG: glycosyltransferase [Bacteroidaceae bacterium]|nr:glycosyltransferase [Bacteroidaceae bacterium]
MKRILYFTPMDIGKRFGGGLASRAYYDAVCRLFPGQVDLMLPEEYCVGPFADAIAVPPRSRIRALLSGSLHRYRLFMRDYLRRNAHLYSLCVLNDGFRAGDMMDMIHGFGLRTMVVHHNFEREYHMGSKSIFTFGGHYAGLVVRNERQAYVKAHVNCFLTAADAQLFEQAYGKRAHNYLLGVFEAADSKLPLLQEVRREPLVAITGSMNTAQTEFGVMNFRERYFHCLRELLPDWKVRIAGRNPSEPIRAFADEYPDVIELIPNPEDMSEVVNPCGVFLCPTHVGGGLKLRVMDGLRQGLPVLTHRVSARGYDAFVGEPFFAVYEDEDSFREGLQKVTSLTLTLETRKQIQKQYAAVFGFEAGLRRMEKILANFTDE